MRKIAFLFALIPSLFFGLNAHLSSLQDTLKTQSQTSFHLIRMLFDGRHEDQGVSLVSGFTYTKETHYNTHKGSLSLISRSEDDSVIIPYLNYTYTDLRDSDHQLTSHAIGGGFKSIIDTDFLSIIAGISVGGSFDSISSLSLDYSYLFANAQLGLGKEIDFFGSRLKITPIIYADYGYIHQKASKNISSEEINFHTLSALAGGQINLGLIQSESTIVSLVSYGFYKHTFIGQEITTQTISQNSRIQNRDSGYVGGGISWKINRVVVDLDVGSEFTKHTYTIQGLARIGVEF